MRTSFTKELSSAILEGNCGLIEGWSELGLMAVIQKKALRNSHDQSLRHGII